MAILRLKDDNGNVVDIPALIGPPGAKIVKIERTNGNGAAGTTDIYTATLSDGSTFTAYTVYNGADGEGAGDMTTTVYDPQGKKTDIFKYVDDAVEGVQITTDAEPAEGSENAVQSGGVYTALKNIEDQIGDISTLLDEINGEVV